MKNKLWIYQIPVVALFTFLFWVTEAGVQGELKHPFLRETLFPNLRTFAGLVTNSKFKFRGPQAPKQKIVIVEIDSQSIEAYGRWPWHRDITAKLVDKVVQAGAKVVGLDITFSEPDQRVSDELKQVLEASNLGAIIPSFETDMALREVIEKYPDQIVLGWMTETACQPAYSTMDECPVTHPDAQELFPKNFSRFAFENFLSPPGFDAQKTAILSTYYPIANLGLYNEVAKSSGYLNAWPDGDGYIRRTGLFMMGQGKPYPSIALAMARQGLGEKLELDLNSNYHVQSLRLANSGRNIEVSPLGVMEINFRGPSRTYPYISATELLDDSQPLVHIQRSRDLASVSRNEIFKDAYVLIGLSAVGVFDMRAFPFDTNTAGVEGHANILDNILSGDMLQRGSGMRNPLWLFGLMIFGALLFAFATERLEAIPALLLFLGVMSGITLADIKLLFEQGVNWNTSLLYVELASIFVFTVSAKYVLEERNKKFIKGAFAKYVSPAIIESIMKDPSKLTVGGDKRDLTIMFSDIRSFTTFSEKLPPTVLAGFLNEYLGTMTDLVFDNEGTLDKYIGDAVMAFWGAPLDQKSHASNACKAAVMMQKKLALMRPVFKQKYDIDVYVGVGVNSGPVNVGNMGSERIFEYTVIGDHVNLASRLEGLTKYYGASILTTRFTFDLIKSAGDEYPPHRVLDFVKVKGKKIAVELIQLFDRDYSADGLRLFEEARMHYLKREWDEAIAKFEQSDALYRQSPDERDETCKMYIERCQELKVQPPAADWDGSWEMTSK